MSPTALIAEDEPLLAAALQAELAKAWPELRVVASVADGHSAVAKALELQPDVLFFDIQMPGQSGLDAALELADEWPTPGPGTSAGSAKPFPALVFVTAYDQYAVQAFEAQAVDYILKPVNLSRLEKTIIKLKYGLESRLQAAPDFEDILNKLRSVSDSKLLSTANRTPALTPLSIIQSSVGNALHMVRVADVLYFEAADKYVRVLAHHEGKAREYLIRTPLKDLLPQLDASIFWQVHRSTVVRAECIEQVSRDEAGKLWLHLRGIAGKLPVSRLYSHLFKAM